MKGRRLQIESVMILSLPTDSADEKKTGLPVFPFRQPQGEHMGGCDGGGAVSAPDNDVGDVRQGDDGGRGVDDSLHDLHFCYSFGRLI